MPSFFVLLQGLPFPIENTDVVVFMVVLFGMIMTGVLRLKREVDERDKVIEGKDEVIETLTTITEDTQALRELVIRSGEANTEAISGLRKAFEEAYRDAP